MVSDSDNRPTADGGAVVDSGEVRDGTQKPVIKKRKKKNTSASKRLRDMERMLAKHGQHLPPGKRREKEEEIASLKAVLVARTNRRKEAEIVKKYRMVKFFEKNKLEKRLKKIAAGDTEFKKEDVQRDLKYVKNYPRNEKYVALFPKSGHTAESRRKVDEMRARIEGRQLENMDNGDEKEEEQDQEEEDSFFLPG